MKVILEPAKPKSILWKDTTPGFIYQNYPEGSYIALSVIDPNKAVNLAVCINPNEENKLSPGELFRPSESSTWVLCTSNLTINPVVSK